MAMEGRIRYPLHKIAEVSFPVSVRWVAQPRIFPNIRENSPQTGWISQLSHAPAHLVPAACSELSRLNEVLPPAASKLAGDRRKSIDLIITRIPVCFCVPEVFGGERRSKQTIVRAFFEPVLPAI
jgi:hypothetical protein